MRLKRGPSRFWALLFKARLVRAPMPFWRVVVEAKLDRAARAWPADYQSAVAAVFVWARTLEEAEALAALALEDQGLSMQTADAMRYPPSAAPKQTPRAVSATQLRFLLGDKFYASEPDPARRGART